MPQGNRTHCDHGKLLLKRSDSELPEDMTCLNYDRDFYIICEGLNRSSTAEIRDSIGSSARKSMTTMVRLKNGFLCRVVLVEKFYRFCKFLDSTMASIEIARGSTFSVPFCDGNIPICLWIVTIKLIHNHGFFVFVVGAIHLIGVKPPPQTRDGLGILGLPHHGWPDRDPISCEEDHHDGERDKHLDQRDALLFQIFFGHLIFLAQRELIVHFAVRARSLYLNKDRPE